MKALKSIALLLLAGAFLYKCSKDGGNSETFSGNGLSGSMARFAINGNYLFTVDNNSLHTFSLADAAHPVQTGHHELGQDIETIFSFKNSLLIGSQSSVYIVNIDNPSTPYLNAQIQHFTACDPVVADGNYAYLTVSTGRPRCNFGWANDLQIYNVSNLSSPQFVNSIGLNQPNGLAVDGKWLFVCDGGIKMFDRTNPTSPTLFKEELGYNSYDCIAANNLLTVSAETGIYQYSYTNSNLTFLSQIPKALPSL